MNDQAQTQHPSLRDLLEAIASGDQRRLAEGRDHYDACPECRVQEELADLWFVFDVRGDGFCLTKEGLRLYDAGRLPSDLDRIARRHAHDCVQCQRKLHAPREAPRPAAPAPIRRRRGRLFGLWAGLPVAAALIIGLVLGYLFRPPPGEDLGLIGQVRAAEYKVGGRLFNLALDLTHDRLILQEIDRSQEPPRVWTRTVIDLRESLRRATGNPDLRSYRLHHPAYDEKRFQDHVQIADVDADGEVEILFAVSSAEDEEIAGRLLCFSEQGNLEWAHRFGGIFRAGDVEGSWKFYVRRLAVVDLEGDNHPEILANVAHQHWAPGQFSILRATPGAVEVLGELWNFGGIGHFETADLDGDGVQEILVGGTNNGYAKGFLAVLQPGLFEREEPGARIGAVPLLLEGNRVPQRLNGQELNLLGLQYLLLLPNTYGTLDAQASPAGDAFRGNIDSLQVYPDQRLIRFASHAQEPRESGWKDGNVAYYRLGFDMKVQELTFSDYYRRVRSDPRPSGYLSRSLEEEREALMKMLYWDGAAWTERPAPVKAP